MTHMSDFSYMERGIINFIALCWILLRIYGTEGLSILNPVPLGRFLLNPRQGTAPLRLIITYLIILSCLTHVIYDIICTKMKYAEGFFYVAATQKCITKEGKDYSADNKILLDVSNTLLSVVFCTKSTAAFLLIAFWSHTGTQIGIKKAFVTSRESKLCSIWAIISVCLYPLLQYSFVSNKLLSTIAPQFLYHFETLMIAILSTVVHLRLRRSIQESAYGFSGVAILKHHMRCNIYLIFWNIVDLIGIASINVDALTTKSFNSNKIWLDICIKLYSTGSTGVFLVMMQILYPEGINPTGNSTRVSHQTPQTNAVKGASALKLQSSVELSKSNPDLHKSGV